MPLEIACSSCGSVLRCAMEIVNARDLLKKMDFRCTSCHTRLSPVSPEIEILPVPADPQKGRSIMPPISMTRRQVRL